MIRALVAATLVATAADRDALVDGKMPPDPALPLVQGKCLLCHSQEYLTQQRLTGAQWQKTVEKMRKFGTPLSDDEAKVVTAYLSKHWTQDLPPQRPVRARPPAPRK